MPAKHKRPASYAGSTPRGPGRWFRAADNAMRKPNSQAGRLFWGRALLAEKVREEYEFGNAVMRHSERDWDYRLPREERGQNWKPRYYSCSVFCAAMVVQLDHGVDGLEDLKHFLVNSASLALVPTRSLKRTVRCQFCGSEIKP